jgi:protein subunit release factor B
MPPGLITPRLQRLGVGPDDLRVAFVRSSGPGGQNVNKVNTCVQLTHLPSGLVIRAESARSQAANRADALDRLADRLESQHRHQSLARAAEAARERRRRARPSRATRRARVETKRRRSSVKALRGKVSDA